MCDGSQRRLIVTCLLVALCASLSAGEIHVAVEDGNLAAVRRLLDKDAALVNANDHANGYRPLHVAIQKGKRDVFDLLLERKADVNGADNYGYRPLHWCPYQQQYEMAEALLKAGADVNALDQSGRIALHWAAQHDRPAAIALLLKHKTKLDLPDKNGQTPLHLAVFNGRKASVESLLAAGARIDLADKNGRTCVQHALQRVNGRGDEVADLILAAVRDVNAPLSDGRAPLHVAAEHGLSKAAASLLKRKADPTSKDKQGRTPLELAIRGQHHEVANLLIPLTDVRDHRFTNGQTLFHWAAERGMADAVKALIARKADPTIAGPDGDTPLHAAAWNGHAGVIEALVAAKVDANAADESGRTPLYSAAWNGHAAAVQALLKSGAYPNRGAQGYTPLHAAAWQGHAGVIAALLAGGANVNTQDADGSTPLHKAAWRGHGEVAQALLAAGADGAKKDNDGFTAADKARSAKRQGIQNLLSKHPAATRANAASGGTSGKSTSPPSVGKKP